MRPPRCPSCSRPLVVPADRRGAREVVCAHCGRRLRRASAAPQAARGAAPAGDVGADDLSALDLLAVERKREHQRRRTMLIAFGAVGSAAAVLVLLVVLALPRPATKAPSAPVAHQDVGIRLPVTPLKDPPPAGQRVEEEDDSPAEQPRPVRPLPVASPEPPPEDARPPLVRPARPAEPEKAVPPVPADDAAAREKKPAPDEGDARKQGEEARKQKERDLQLKLQTKVKGDIVRAAEELASSGPEGKLAASKALCAAQLSPDRNLGDCAADALAKINEPLQRRVRQLLIDNDYANRVAAVQEIGRLGAADAPEAALRVLLDFKSRVLPNARRLGAKSDYAKNPDAGLVVDTAWVVVKDKRELHETLKKWLQGDPNPHVRSAAARYYPQTDTAANAVALLRHCLKNDRDDDVRVALIAALVAAGDEAKKAKRDLDNLSKNEGSKKVRDAATEALKQVGAGD